MSTLLVDPRRGGTTVPVDDIALRMIVQNLADVVLAEDADQRLRFRLGFWRGTLEEVHGRDIGLIVKGFPSRREVSVDVDAADVVLPATEDPVFGTVITGECTIVRNHRLEVGSICDVLYRK